MLDAPDATPEPLEETPDVGGYGDTPETEAPDDEARRLALVGLFGTEPPFANPDATEDEFVAFAESLWDRHEAQSAHRVHRAIYLRRFRLGEQWLSSSNRGPWREPPRPKNTVRAVLNMFGPALDWRLQILSENRPGARVGPATLDQDDMRRAQAGQQAWEYQYHQQQFAGVIREAGFWAQTDGCAFIESYWDTDRGPVDPEVGPLGDIKPCVLRIENVRVSANATANEAPLYWVIRRVVPLQDAIARYGEDVAGEGNGSAELGLQDTFRGSARFTSDRLIEYNQADMVDDQDTVDEYTVYVARNERFLPEGIQFKVVGTKLVYGPMPLQTKRPPIVRVTDGSPDPSFFPRPVCEDWVDDQVRLNAVFSKWIESVRRNAGGRLLAKAQSIVADTLTGDQDTIIEVRAPGSLGDVVQPLQGFSVGRDATGLIEAMVKRLEDLTGWNDTARGQFASDASGRAILAVREQLERTFAPMVYAMAEAVKQHIEITLDWMRWGYTMPRAIGATGRLRPDLGRLLVGDDLDGQMNVTLDPETMMPMPRSLRLYMLDDWLSRGLITPEEYRERYGFAIVQDVRTPKRLQEAAAMRTVDAVRTGQPVPDIEWVHDEAVFQDVIERELLLADPTQVDEEQRALARQLWQAYANQAAMKLGQVPAAPTQTPGASQGAPEPLGLPPQQAPTMALPSGIATDPLLRNQTVESQAAALFERTAPR